MKRKNRFKIFLAVGITVGLQTSLSGQQHIEGADVPSFNLPTNQTWSFIKYGGSPGDLHTGAVGAMIPIFEYQDDDFSFPISLNYASGGYMPNRAVGIVGPGWYLNIGGTLTREVVGFPDDRNIRQDAGISYMGYFCRQISEFNSEGLPLTTEWLIPGNHHVTFTGGREVEEDPDVFHFSFMGHSGSFIGYGDNAKVFNSAGPAQEYKIITYTQLGQNAGWWENVPFSLPDSHSADRLYEQDRLQTIYIIAGDGLRYQFKALEATADYRLNDFEFPYKLTWYLTRIYAPNGREMIFNYQQESQIIGHTPKANNFSVSDPASPGATTLGTIPSIMRYQPYTLRSIQVKDSPSVLRTLVSLSYANRDNVYLVSQIKIDKDGNGLDKSYTFAYTEYGQGSNKNPFLTTLATPLGNYRFSYLDYTAGSFPNQRSEACYGVDHWGFYNGKPNTRTTYIPSSSIDARYNETITGMNREPDYTYAKRGMLETIHYPTGGKTVFEYEPHTYSKSVVRDYTGSDYKTAFHPRLVTLTTPKVAGGVRLKSIEDYDTNGSAYTRVSRKEYEYTENNGSRSSGILLKSPRYRIQYRIFGTRRQHFSSQPLSFSGLMDLADESAFPATYDKTHIGYSEVKEKNLDGSYTVYRFSNYQDIPDVMPAENEMDYRYSNSQSTYYLQVATSGSDNGLTYTPQTPHFVNNLLTEPMSMHLYRGKPKEICQYDNRGILIEKTAHSYFDEASRHPVWEAFELRAGDAVYPKKIAVESRPLIKTVMTRMGLIEQIEYSYNILGRLSKTKKWQSDGSSNITITRYPGDPSLIGAGPLIENNLYSLPVQAEVRIQKPGESVESLVSRTDYIYNHTGTGANLNYAVTEIKSKAFDPPRSTSVSAGELETEIQFEYDSQGKLRQSTTRDGKKTAYLWGYYNKYIIAIVENATFSQIQGILGTTLITNLSTGNPSSEDIKNLWTQLNSASSLSAAHIHVAAYRNHAGITLKIDPSGRKSYYEYDPQDRLMTVKDENGSILENYTYRLRSN